MRTRTLGNPDRPPHQDGPRTQGAYVVDQAGGVIRLGQRTRHYIKHRTRRPRSRATGHIKF